MLRIIAALILVILSVQAFYLEDVEKYTKKFAELVIFETNSTKVLKNLIENLEELFELGKPIGALVTSVNPDEDQRKALEKLNSFMREKFNELENYNEKYRKKGERHSMYDNYVRHRLEKLRDAYDSLAGISFRFHDDYTAATTRMTLDTNCRLTTRDVLSYFTLFYHSSHCPLPSKLEIYGLSTTLEALNLISTYHTTSTLPKRICWIRVSSPHDDFKAFAETKRRLLGEVNMKNDLKVGNLASTLKYSRHNPALAANPQDVLKSIEENSRFLFGHRGICELNTVAQVSAYDREELNTRLENVRLDLTNMAGFAHACANRSSPYYGNERKEEEKYLKNMHNMVKEIGDFVETWMNASTEISWPQIHREIAKTVLLNHRSLSSHELGNYAYEIQKELNKRAPLGYYHQVLMTETSDFLVLARDEENHFSFELGKFECHVFRLKLRKENEADGLFQWFQGNHDRVHKHILDAQDFSSLDFLKNLNTTFNLVGENRWSVALQLRKEAFLCSWAEMVGAFGARNESGYSEVSEIRTKHNGWSNCFNSRVFLLV